MRVASLTVTTLREKVSASRSVVGPKNFFSKFCGIQMPSLSWKEIGSSTMIAGRA